MRLLVVDDDPGIASLLLVNFRRYGYVIECAADGRTAVQRLRTTTYSAVLLDLMLPELTGFEVLRDVKSFAPDLMGRIIVLTAASLTTLADFDQSEVYKLIRKPFDLNELTEAVLSLSASTPPGSVPSGERRAVNAK